METRKCKSCNKKLNIELFGLTGYTSVKTGILSRDYTCKKCRYKKKDPERLKINQLTYISKNLEKVRLKSVERSSRFRKEHPEKDAFYRRKFREDARINLKDRFIKQSLGDLHGLQSKIKPNDVPLELIAAKRSSLMLKRAIKQIKSQI